MSLATAPHAGADESQPPMQTVEIKGNLDRLVPYKSPYYEMAREVESATGGRLVLGIQLSSLRPRERIDDIKLRLETDAEAVPVEVDKNGLFIVPMLDRMARRDDARFSVNRRKGTLVASGVLLPAVPKDAWTIGGVRQITSDLHTALAAVAPWYLKPMAVLKAWNRGVSVCAPRRGTSLKVVKGAATVATVPLDSAARDHANQAVFCHAFNGKETYEDSSRLVLPDEATVLLL
jgi:hypothetical protein